MEKSYFYGRVAFAPEVTKFFLDQDGVLNRRNTNGWQEFVLAAYAGSVIEAREVVRAAREVSTQFRLLADDLETYIDNYDFTIPRAEADAKARRTIGMEQADVD